MKGIYAITNTLTDRVYYGQSKDCENRLRVHERALRGNYHHNPILQASWNKNGSKCFVFSLILSVATDLTRLEKKFISEAYSIGLKPFNIADPEAPTTFYGNKNGLGYRHTPEAREKISAGARQQRGKLHPHKGHSQTPEHIEKMRNGIIAYWARRKALKTPAIAQEGP